MTWEGAKKVGVDDRKTIVAISIVLMALFFLFSISASLKGHREPASITVFPEAPKEGLPIEVAITLSNPSLLSKTVDYSLYADGTLVLSGSTTLAPFANEEFTYIHPKAPPIGERTSFYLKTAPANGDGFEKTVSVPAYPPQVWSSFVSFASFSTSIMSSMAISSFRYYDQSFMGVSAFNIGLIFSMSLIILLVFLELTEPLVEKTLPLLGLRRRFSRLSALLFMVFAGMVLTKIVLIIG